MTPETLRRAAEVLHSKGEKNMTCVHRGVMRLSLFAGGIGALLWLGFAFFESDGFERVEGAGWLIFFGGMLVCFAIAYALARIFHQFFSGFQWRDGLSVGIEGFMRFLDPTRKAIRDDRV